MRHIPSPMRRMPDSGERLLRRPQNTASLDAAITPLPGLDKLRRNSTIYRRIPGLPDRQQRLQQRRAGVSTSPQGFIANLAITYDVAPHVQLLCHRVQHLQFALRTGERCTKPRARRSWRVLGQAVGRTTP